MSRLREPPDSRNTTVVSRPRMEERLGQVAFVGSLFRTKVNSDILGDVQEGATHVVVGVLDCNKDKHIN